MPQKRGSLSADLRFLQNLAYLVPGYRAYRDVALRRGEDSRLRARVLAAIKATRDRIHELQELWTAKEVDPRWTELLAGGIRELSRLAEELRYCPAQSEAFFSIPKLPTDLIDELLEADLLVLGDLEHLGRAVDALPENPPRRKGMRRMLGDVHGGLQDLAGHLLHRDAVLSRLDDMTESAAAPLAA
ncbi:MAG: hypothetical protein GF355_16825 [Candidatus Eisenbacteria bacterium]|nr:hypothetical protein [Candidatus Eisenbacteria bacterium]